MTDLRERIEIRMAEMQNTDGAYCVPCQEHVNCVACQQFIDVITDVLDRHQPVPDVELDGVVNCSECTEEYSNGHVPAEYPCGTVKAIAEALGVLDDDD